MKNSGTLLLLLVALVAVGYSQDPERERLAVLRFGIKGITPDEGLLLRQRFAEALEESSRFDVLPLPVITNRLEEVGLRNVDSCTTFPCLAELGKILDAPKVVYASVTRLENRFILHIQLVRSSDAALLYDERIDHSGEFSTLLSEVIPAQGRKLGMAHLDRGTPWYFVAAAVLVGVGLIYWIYSSWGTSSADDPQMQSHPTTQ
jgi:hypothetical protein